MVNEDELATRFIEKDGYDLKWGRIAGTVASSVLLAIVAGYTTVFEALVGVQLWVIDGFGWFVSRLVGLTLGESAKLVADSWAVAARNGVQAGVLLPFLLAVQAVLALTFIAWLWERRPYS